MCAIAGLWRSGDNFLESILSSHHMNLMGWTQEEAWSKVWSCQQWWWTPVIPALKTGLWVFLQSGYIGRISLKKIFFNNSSNWIPLCKNISPYTKIAQNVLKTWMQYLKLFGKNRRANQLPPPFCFVFKKGSHVSPGWPWIYSVAKNDLDVGNFLPLLPECVDHRHEPPPGFPLFC